jgi:hypothetical protein
MNISARGLLEKECQWEKRHVRHAKNEHVSLHTSVARRTATLMPTKLTPKERAGIANNTQRELASQSAARFLKNPRFGVHSVGRKAGVSN